MVQPEGARGSLKWIQRAVNVMPRVLVTSNSPATQWVSPLRDDGWAEYRDAGFLERIGHPELVEALSAFWPARGPQWDALGTRGEQVVLVEAKAHISEFFSPGTAASPESRRRIAEAFALVQADLGLEPTELWLDRFYQYANRIAHLWFLRNHGVDARLMFVSFIGDDDIGGPRTKEPWEVAFAAADYTLGIGKRHALSRYIEHVFPDVKALA